jgi:hypothetical protein
MIEKSKKEKRENDYCERLMKGSSSKIASFVENIYCEFPTSQSPFNLVFLA